MKGKEGGKKEKKEKKKRALCADLEIIKVSYVLFSLLTNNVIF